MRGRWRGCKVGLFLLYGVIIIIIIVYFIIRRNGEIRDGWRGHQWMRRKVECGVFIIHSCDYYSQGRWSRGVEASRWRSGMKSGRERRSKPIPERIG